MEITACNASAINPSVFETWNNTLYSPSTTFSNGPCDTFAKWQGQGQDKGSTVIPMLSVPEIVALGKTELSPNEGTHIPTVLKLAKDVLNPK
jgi:hypothetical protein